MARFRILTLSPTHCCTIVESVSEGVITIDAQKRVTYLNPAAERITGFSSAEAVGRKCFDVLRADLCARRCPLDDCLQGECPPADQRVVLIAKGGGRVMVRLNVAPLKDENGRILGAVETLRDLTEIEQLRRHIDRRYTPEDIVGRHPRIRALLALLPDIAVSDSAVLIEGPTGSGKELIARAIHGLSRRSDGPFIAVNCAALPDTLLESELFGYAKGAFTGAVRDKSGRILAADRGTLFLDEIGSTSTAFQADLLRVLEDGVFTPLGSNRPRRSDFRLVTASNLDLKAQVREGRFREDLYYRLNVVKVSLPPLRERREDIPLLVDHVVRRFNMIKGREIQGVAPEVLNLLLDYPFPGNIRELENIIEYAFVTCREKLIRPEHLPQEIREEVSESRCCPPPETAAQAEKIRTVLAGLRGNRLAAARALGISRTTLWRRMRKYGLSSPFSPNGEKPKSPPVKPA